MKKKILGGISEAIVGIGVDIPGDVLKSFSEKNLGIVNIRNSGIIVERSPKESPESCKY